MDGKGNNVDNVDNDDDDNDGVKFSLDNDKFSPTGGEVIDEYGNTCRQFKLCWHLVLALKQTYAY
jgi:hypothetical protein